MADGDTKFWVLLFPYVWIQNSSPAKLKRSIAMATPTYLKPHDRYSDLDSATAIALVLTESMKRKSPTKEWPFIRDISTVLYDLRSKGFYFKNLGLRPVPGGYYSEDVETFIGQLLSMGYATQRSPIRLEKKGEELCHEILQAEQQTKGEEVKRLTQALDELLPPQVATF
jgi:hypothetical protein